MRSFLHALAHHASSNQPARSVLPRRLLLLCCSRHRPCTPHSASVNGRGFGDHASGSSLLDLALRIEPLRAALWDAGMPCTLYHALHDAWKQDMQPAAAAASWLTARTPGAADAALPCLMQRVADKDRQRPFWQQAAGMRRVAIGSLCSGQARGTLSCAAVPPSAECRVGPAKCCNCSLTRVTAFLGCTVQAS